jgi:hypothetical protein
MREITHHIHYHQALALIKQRLQGSLDRAQSLNLSRSLWDKFPADMCAPAGRFRSLLR